MKIVQISDIHVAEAHLLPDLAESIIKKIKCRYGVRGPGKMEYPTILQPHRSG